VTLFANRARSADARFALTGDTMSAAAWLVARLDGMPLAIELAAARVVALGVTQLLDRLDVRLAPPSAPPAKRRLHPATPSGSFCVSIYHGTDPLTGRQIRLRRACKPERAAQIELGRLLEQAAAGRQRETNAAVGRTHGSICRNRLAAGGGHDHSRDPVRHAHRGRAAPLCSRSVPCDPFRRRPLHYALAALADEGLVLLRQGGTANMSGEADPKGRAQDVAKVIAEGRKVHPEMAPCLWLAGITGARRSESYALEVDVDLDTGIRHIAFNYVVVDSRWIRKDTKTHRDRYLAIDSVTCAMIRGHLEAIRARLADVGLGLRNDT
jgi:hypothetical protein